METVFLIDDDIFFSKSLSNLLSKYNYNVETFHSYSKFIKSFNAHAKVDLVITDFKLPDNDGLELIKTVKATRPDLPVILITNYCDISTAVKSIKLGAFEFVSKPIISEEFLKVVKQSLQSKNTLVEKPEPNELIKGESMKGFWKQVDKVAQSNFSVLITGESGSGKELIARYIHDKSSRKDKKFVAVDCGAISEEMVLSELFGHEKGAFTGAIQKKIGQFEYTHKGTLFLDEIGNLSYNSQLKILRALQERKIRRLGGNEDIKIDIRLICATNENLEKAINQNHFRLDLYHRINEFPIHVPPLRERLEDLDLYMEFFAQQAALQLDKKFKGIDKRLRKKLKDYHWPGNLRELNNFMKRGVLLADEEVITEDHLPELSIQDNPSSNTNNLKSIQSQNEKKTIEDVLKKYKYNKSKAAEELGITRATLYKKIDEFDL
ncbi:MAG: response regulator [Bacteroidetes bacterium]|nr:response regulator [Bacteroidota bacterium]